MKNVSLSRLIIDFYFFLFLKRTGFFLTWIISDCSRSEVDLVRGRVVLRNRFASPFSRPGFSFITVQIP